MTKITSKDLKNAFESMPKDIPKTEYKYTGTINHYTNFSILFPFTSPDLENYNKETGLIGKFNGVCYYVL